jgi:hypothetical protein
LTDRIFVESLFDEASPERKIVYEEPLHQVALVWANVGLEKGYAQRLEGACKSPQLAKMLDINAKNGLLLKTL